MRATRALPTGRAAVQPLALAAALLALPATAQVVAPGELTDPIKYLHGDVYDPTPERRAEWEAMRVRENGLLIDLGSVTTKEFDAIERGTLNLPLASWLTARADVRNDRDRQGAVTRLTVDLLGRVGPWLSIGPSGSPAARKDGYSIGGAALLANEARDAYLLVRLIADSFVYNRLNLEGGTRRDPVWHLQLEARWLEEQVAQGRLSIYGALDAQTLSDVSYPAAPLLLRRASSRTEAQLHLRWERPALEASLVGELTVLRDLAEQRDGDPIVHPVRGGGVSTLRFTPPFDDTAAGQSRLQRTLAQLRAQVLVAPFGEASELRLRAQLRLLREAAAGDAFAGPYAYRRLEPGARLALFWQRREQQAEFGYAAAVAAQQLTGPNPVDQTDYQDKAYVSWEYSLSPQVHLRALIAWEFQGHHFGGGNGSLLGRF